MNGNALIALVREYIKDEESPYLWSDDLIIQHLQKAEREMCAKTHVLINTAVAFDTVSTQNIYDLGTDVLRVYAVRVAANGYPLNRLRGKANSLYMQSDNTGEPKIFSTNLSYRSVTLYPSPDAVYSMEAICAVYPATPIDNETESLLDSEHHVELANYAAYRCLTTNDVDGAEIGTADQYKDMWYEYLRDLKRDIYRYRTGDSLVLQNWTGASPNGSSNVKVGT